MTKFEFQVVLFCCTGAMATISVILTDRKNNTGKGEEEKCAVSVVTLKQIIRLSIYLESKVIYLNIHLHRRLKGTLN